MGGVSSHFYGVSRELMMGECVALVSSCEANRKWMQLCRRRLCTVSLAVSLCHVGGLDGPWWREIWSMSGFKRREKSLETVVPRKQLVEEKPEWSGHFQASVDSQPLSVLSGRAIYIFFCFRHNMFYSVCC